MSSRPTHTLHPSAKLTADNVAELELSSHRCMVASTTSVTHRPPANPSSPLSLPEPSPPGSVYIPAPSLATSDSDLAQARTSCKRPQASRDGVNTAPTLVDGHDGAPVSKKAKTNGSPTDLDASGMHSDVQVMDIDDVNDPHEESLNKTDPTADIKAFFTPLHQCFDIWYNPQKLAKVSKLTSSQAMSNLQQSPY
ncbi:hypothetical protein EDB86DRAFT_2828970 [Lactarius hatsudake]|nr:hypothetical protein EDB86DRAFT_2828970 [Lactarius hatsudake]